MLPRVPCVERVGRVRPWLITKCSELIPFSPFRGTFKTEVSLTIWTAYQASTGRAHWSQPGETSEGETGQESGAPLSPTPQCSG